jgi:antigen flippase
MNKDIDKQLESEAPSNKHIGVRTFVDTFGTSVFIQACGVLQGILVARILGPVGRGQYAAVILWPMLFAGIGIFGSNIALARASAKTVDHGHVIRTAILLALMTSILTAIVCYIALPYLMPQDEKNLVVIARIFVIFILLNHLGLNLIAVDQGAGNFKSFNITRALLNPIYVLFLIVLWLCGVKELIWYVASLLIANFVVVLIRLVRALRTSKLWGTLYSPVSAIKQSLHFGLAGMAIPVYLQADKAMLLWLLGAENLGFYTVGLSASEIIGSVTSSMGMVSFTVAAQSGYGDGFEKIAKAFRISALLWLIFGSILAVLMQVALPLVFGKDFAPAVNTARLLIIGSAFGGLANLLEQSMRGQGRAFVGLEGRIAGLIVMVLVGLLLAKPFGLSGVCIAFILCQLTCLSVIVWRTIHHYPTAKLSDILPRWIDAANMIDRINRKLALFLKRKYA